MCVRVRASEYVCVYVCVFDNCVFVCTNLHVYIPFPVTCCLLTFTQIKAAYIPLATEVTRKTEHGTATETARSPMAAGKEAGQ